ncbi:hypothetical protein T484DRAFT_1915987, partial [Baffinella frigidus]
VLEWGGAGEGRGGGRGGDGGFRRDDLCCHGAGRGERCAEATPDRALPDDAPAPPQETVRDGAAGCRTPLGGGRPPPRHPARGALEHRPSSRGRLRPVVGAAPSPGGRRRKLRGRRHQEKPGRRGGGVVPAVPRGGVAASQERVGHRERLPLDHGCVDGVRGGDVPLQGGWRAPGAGGSVVRRGAGRPPRLQDWPAGGHGGPGRRQLVPLSRRASRLQPRVARRHSTPPRSPCIRPRPRTSPPSSHTLHTLHTRHPPSRR